MQTIKPEKIITTISNLKTGEVYKTEDEWKAKGVPEAEIRRDVKVFMPSLAQAYPSITDELKKDVAILSRSLSIREKYIDDLREAKDSLARKLDISEMHIETLEKGIKRYQEFFYRTKELERVQ